MRREGLGMRGGGGRRAGLVEGWRGVKVGRLAGGWEGWSGWCILRKLLCFGRNVMVN